MRPNSRILLLLFLAASALASHRLERLREEEGHCFPRDSRSSLEELAANSLGGLRAFVLDALWCRATDLSMRKEWHAAAATFEAIEALEPRVPEATIAHAWTMIYSVSGEAVARGDVDAAWSWLERGLSRLEEGRRRNPASARLAYYQSFILYDKGKSEPFWSRFLARGIDPVLGSRELAAEAFRLDPANPALAYWLASISRHASHRLGGEGDLEGSRRAARAGLDALDRAEGLLPEGAEGDMVQLFRDQVAELDCELRDLERRETREEERQ